MMHPFKQYVYREIGSMLVNLSSIVNANWSLTLFTLKSQTVVKVFRLITPIRCEENGLSLNIFCFCQITMSNVFEILLIKFFKLAFIFFSVVNKNRKQQIYDYFFFCWFYCSNYVFSFFFVSVASTTDEGKFQLIFIWKNNWLVMNSTANSNHYPIYTLMIQKSRRTKALHDNMLCYVVLPGPIFGEVVYSYQVLTLCYLTIG